MDHAAPLDPDPDLEDLRAARPWLGLDPVSGLRLHGVPLREIARDLETPCWVTSADVLRARAERLSAALSKAGLHRCRTHFAVKACDHLAVLFLLRELGLGCDVVSEGEFARARHVGVAASDIVFSGVGKTDAALTRALREGVGQINVESEEELHRIAHLARAAGRVAPVALRVNPDIAAGGHARISTGKAGDKFGIPTEEIARLYRVLHQTAGLSPQGLAVHIGSQITTLAPFRAAYALLAALARDLMADGLSVPRLDCGGGLGVSYRDETEGDPDGWARVIADAFAGLDVDLAIEPGRWLAAPAGLLLTRVIGRKCSEGQDLLIVDASMTELARPSLYGAWHGLLPVHPEAAHAPRAPRTVVGPVCESTDVLTTPRDLPDLPAGALLAVLDTGAYGSVMSSTYNARPLAAHALVSGDEWRCIRPRQTIEALWAEEYVPRDPACP